MYQIGEFSYLCETSIKTLRHYHKIGLLKPVKVDYYTGYRYYDDKQVQEFKLIKELQEAGLSLEKIKEIVKNFDKTNIQKQIVKIENEKNKQVQILKDLIKHNTVDDETLNVEFIPNEQRYFIGRFQKAKNRNVDISLEKFKNHNKVFISYEKGYKEEDILCFVGLEISKKEKNSLTSEDLAKENLEILSNDSDKVTSVLHTKVNNSLLESYQDIIKFASKNAFQIRGEFYEIESNGQIDIYVEAYDLKVENKDDLKHQKYLEKNLKNIYPKELVGTWQLQGEIIELPNFFDKNNEHYVPDTELTEITLNDDGTTNFSYITWKENYLLINYNNKIIYDKLLLSKDKNYLGILINLEYSNSRPYTYYYKKIK